jgi:hypothetical protein
MEGVYETLYERVDELIGAHKHPLLSTTGTHAALDELIARVEGHEEAIREIAREVEELAGGRATRKEPGMAGKKRPKSPARTEKKSPTKPKRQKKTSRGK